MSLDETRLIQRAKEGDSAAFVEIYDWHQPTIYRYISYRVESAGMAEDLTGEVFVCLVESIDRFPQDGLLLAQLYAIADNLIAGKQSSASPQEKAPEQRLAPQCFASAIAHLADEHRQVILLKFVEGLGDETIARTLDKSVDAILALQQQALSAFAMAVTRCDTAQVSLSARRHQEELERLLGDGIQNLAHELRTPLNLVHGYAELLLSSILGPIHPEQRDALQVIYDGAETLSHLIRDLTLLRNIPRESLTLAPLSIPGWVESVLDRSRSLAGQVGIQLETHLPDDLPTILGDQEHLKVALAQVVDNAIKFSPDGGQVSVRAWVDNEEWLHVAVQDHGIGIAHEHLDQIFDRFYQVDGSPTRRFGGAGIGLNVVRAVAEAHGGQVRVVSEGVGKGSTFTLVLPVQPFESLSVSRQPSLEHCPLLGQYLGRVLNEYLLPLEDGQVTLEECLAHYPEYAVELRPLLEVALKVRRIPRPTLSFAAFAAGKRWMLDVLAEKKRRRVTFPGPLARRTGWLPPFLGKWKRAVLSGRVPVLRPVLAGALALILFIIGGQFLFPLIGVTVPRTAALVQAGGTVEVLPTGDAIWRRALIDEQIEAGDRIRTGPFSFATLRFFDGSTTDLEAETDITVAQMFSRRDSSGKVIVLHQWMGRTYNSVESLTDMASRFQVETPVAVMAVRGTEFEIVVGVSGATRVAVVKGGVDVTTQETTVAVLAGEEKTIWHGPSLLAVPLPHTATAIPTFTPMSTLSLYPVQDTLPWTPTPSETPLLVEVVRRTNTPRPAGTSVPPGGGAGPTDSPQPATAAPPTAVPTLRPTPTRPRPTPTPLPTDTPTLVPTLTSTFVPTNTLIVTPTITPTAVVTLTITPTITPSVIQTRTLEATEESGGE